MAIFNSYVKLPEDIYIINRLGLGQNWPQKTDGWTLKNTKVLGPIGTQVWPIPTQRLGAGWIPGPEKTTWSDKNEPIGIRYQTLTNWIYWECHSKLLQLPFGNLEWTAPLKDPDSRMEISGVKHLSNNIREWDALHMTYLLPFKGSANRWYPIWIWTCPGKHEGRANAAIQPCRMLWPRAKYTYYILWSCADSVTNFCLFVNNVHENPRKAQFCRVWCPVQGCPVLISSCWLAGRPLSWAAKAHFSSKIMEFWT